MPLAEDRKQFVGVVDVFLDADAVVARERAHLQILAHRQAREDFSSFRRLRNADANDLIDPQSVNRLSLKRDRTLPRAVAARDAHQRASFAGAVGADDRDDLAFIDLQRNAFEHFDRPVAGVEVVDV